LMPTADVRAFAAVVQITDFCSGDLWNSETKSLWDYSWCWLRWGFPIWELG
jgi:hypothetical protein